MLQWVGSGSAAAAVADAAVADAAVAETDAFVE